jgi:hypothetical protein
MSSSLKRVNPTDVQAYGTAAQGYFDSIYTALTTLCSDVVGVHYYGTNAYQFKYDAGELAEAFARGMAKDLGSLADGIRATTSNIAGALGGAPISITVSGKEINAPTPQADTGIQEVDPTALTDLITTVGTRFTEISDAMEGHKTRLENTDWKGDARDGTLTMVAGWTTNAQTKATDAQTKLVDFINKQIETVGAADAVPSQA